MSLVLAVKKGKTIYACADTQTTIGSLKENITTIEDLKIKKINKNTLVIRTGSVGTTHAIIYNNEVRELLNTRITKSYLIKNVIPKFIEILSKNNLLNRNNKNLPTMDASFLIVQSGYIYKIKNDFNIEVYTDYVAIGSPIDIVYSYLKNAPKQDDVEKYLLQIAKESTKFDCSTSAPFVTINTQNMEYKFAEEEIC